MAADDGSNVGKNILDGFNSSLNDAIKRFGEAFTNNFSASEIAKTVVELDNAAVGVAKSFGQGRENVLGIKQAMADAVISVTKLGGGLEDIAKIQEGVGSELGRNLVLASDSYEKLYAASKVTGQSAESIVGSFKNAGISAYQAAGEMEKVVQRANAVGVSASAVSKQVTDNITALNKYNFQGGVEGMARMAAQATSLRIDMKSSLDFAEKVFNPEGAIEMAAAMQRLGVANSDLLDPLRLMDLSQNDPAELQNQMVKMSEQFVRLNEKGQFEIMPGAKRQLREIEQAMGLPAGQLSKMALASAEVGEKMRQIKFPDTFTEDQKQMFANMAEMGKDGEFKITLGGKTMGLEEAFREAKDNPEMLEALKKASEPKTLEDLAADQLKISESIDASLKSLVKVPLAVARGKMATEALELPKDVTKLLAETFDTQALSVRNLGEGLDKGITDVLEAFRKVSTGEGSLTGVLDTLGAQFESINKFGGDAYAQSVEKFTTSFDKVGIATNEFYKILEPIVTKLGKSVIDWEKGGENANNQVQTVPGSDVLKLPGKNVELLPQDTFAAFTKGSEVLSGLMGNKQIPQSGPTESTVTANINLNISAPPNIDTAQLMIAMQDTGVKQALVDVVSKGRFNDGLTSINPNNVQAMRTMAEMSGNLG